MRTASILITGESILPALAEIAINEAISLRKINSLDERSAYVETSMRSCDSFSFLFLGIENALGKSVPHYLRSLLVRRLVLPPPLIRLSRYE
jgi:hypothetical protein